MLRELKGSNPSLYTATPCKGKQKASPIGRDLSRSVKKFDSQSSGECEDPADMMRVLGNEEALFMTLSENGAE